MVKPVVLRRRIIRRDRPGGPDPSSRKSPLRGALVVDRRLDAILETTRLSQPGDLWDLPPPGMAESDPFTTRDLARKLDAPLAFAQRVAYRPRLSGAVEPIGKRGNSHLYQAREALAPAQAASPSL